MESDDAIHHKYNLRNLTDKNTKRKLDFDNKKNAGKKILKSKRLEDKTLKSQRVESQRVESQRVETQRLNSQTSESDDEYNADDEYKEDDEIDKKSQVKQLEQDEEAEDDNDVDDNSENDDKINDNEDSEDDLEEELSENEYKDKDEENSENKNKKDWLLNRRDLALHIYSILTKHFPANNQEDLSKMVKICAEIVSSANENIISEYCQAEPADKKWKIGLDEQTIQKLEPILMNLREKIKRTQPTMVKILNANITKKDKRKALRLYDIWMNIEPYTEEWMTMESQINTVLSLKKQDRKMKELEKQYTEKLDTLEDSDYEFKKKIFSLDASENIKLKIYDKFLKYKRLDPTDSDARNAKEWLYFCTQLPYNKIHHLPINNEIISEITKFCTLVYKKMDEELYGMYDVKLKLITILNNRLTNKNSKGCITGLIGEPGTGKSTITKVFANAIGLPFDRLSVAGLDDTAVLKGSDPVWSGASPNIILQIQSRLKCSNPAIQIDEIDKIPHTDRGNAVYHALLHILDPSQNDQVRDSFISEFLHDMSRIWFFPTMNSIDGIHPALLDRMEIIKVPSYTRKEQEIIVQKYTLPKIMKELFFEKNSICFTEEGLNELFILLKNDIDHGGIRPIEKSIREILSKINLLRTLGSNENSDLHFKPNVPLWQNGYKLTKQVVQEFIKIEQDKNEKIPSMYM
jgi:ATP-dependent Lon protease